MDRVFELSITDRSGCTYLITCWYTRFEVGKRLAAFWLVSVVLNAFAAIFAYALTLLDGTYGIEGWRCELSAPSAMTILATNYYRDFYNRGDYY